MSKYKMEFEVAGGADRKLGLIESALASFGETAGKVAYAAGYSLGSLQDKLENLSKTDMHSMAESLQGLSERVGNLTGRITGAMHDMGEKIVEDAAMFEDSQADLKFAYGDAWESVYGQVLKDSAKLTFTFQDTIGLASSLGRMKINPFGGITEESQKFVSKTGETVRALEILQDTADASGRDVGGFMFAIREAVSGDMKSITDALDMPRTVTGKWKKDMDGLTDQQAKYNYLVKELGATFGGAGALKADNWNKVTAQIPDLLQQLRAGAGKEGLQAATRGVKELVGALGDLVSNKEIMAGLSSAVKMVGDLAAAGIRLAARGVEWVTKILSAAPWLPKLAMGLTLVSVAMLTVVGTVISATAAFGAFGAELAVIGSEVLIPAGIALAALIPVMIVLAPIVAGTVLLFKAGADVIERKWGGSITIFEKLKTVFGALSELFSSFDGTAATMSLETMDKLQEQGLLGFVQDALAVFYKLNAAWEEFSTTLDEAYKAIAPTFIPMIEELGDLFDELFDALGLNDTAVKANESSTEDWTDTAHSMAEALIEVTKYIIAVTRTTTAIVRVGMAFFHVKERINGVKNIVHLLGEAFSWLSEKMKPVLEKFHILDRFGGSKGGGKSGIDVADMAGSLITGGLLSGKKKKASAPLFHDKGELDEKDASSEGDAYKDKDGNFDMGQLYDPNMGVSRKEFMKDPSKYLNDEDAARIRRGQRIKKRAVSGPGTMGIDEALNYTTDGQGGDTRLASLNASDSEIASARSYGGVQKNRDAIDSEKLRLQADNNRLLGELLKKIDKTSVQVDGKEIAIAGQSANMGVAGR